MAWCQTPGNRLIIEGRVVPVTIQCTPSVVMHTQARSTGELLCEKLAVTRKKHVRKRGELFDRCPRIQ